MIISVDKTKLNSLLFNENFRSFFDVNETEFFGNPGTEHYKLLSYFSTLFNNATIIDIGTHRGSSSLALSYNKSNTIHTFDIVDKVINNNIKNVENIQFHLDNLFETEGQEKWCETIKNSPFIFLDVDPHNGTMEIDFFNYLKKIDYKGFVICDDIWYFKEMRDNFWYKVDYEYRYDITDLGHVSGTGIINFNKDIIFNKNDNSNWTLVTAYFNLTKCPDASSEIIKRDQNYYFSHSISTLSLPYNLVIYCDTDSYAEIQKIRPSFLNDKTKYIIKEFDSFIFNKNNNDNTTFKEYRNIINTNRKNKPYSFDNRNTASYYLFCMSRYAMLKETIELNPFDSSHFCWINFCIERMGYNNLKYLDEALFVKRDKFSTCYIDYIPETLVNNTPKYFEWGRCGMCSGFFTGDKNYMYKVCDLIENKFLEYLNLGYGHADEQLFTPVYFENPELFEHYYGDYLQMITNYTYVYDAPENPIRNFIRNSFNNQNYIKCIEGCKFLLKSLKLNKCKLSQDQLNILYGFYINSKLIIDNNNYYSFDEEFISIDKELTFIYNNLIQPKLNNKSENKSCYDLCEKIINTVNSQKVNLPSNIYFLIWFTYYVSSFYVNSQNSVKIVENISNLCKTDVLFKNEYEKNKSFYDTQFAFVGKI